MKTILAAPNLLKIEKISFCSDEVRLVVKTRLMKATCPSCGRKSDKAHSRYQRHLAELPWEGVAVKLILFGSQVFLSDPGAVSKSFVSDRSQGARLGRCLKIHALQCRSERRPVSDCQPAFRSRADSCCRNDA